MKKNHTGSGQALFCLDDSMDQPSSSLIAVSVQGTGVLQRPSLGDRQRCFLAACLGVRGAGLAILDAEALADQKFKLAAWLMQKRHPCMVASFLRRPVAGLSRPPAPVRGTGRSFA